MRSIHYTNSMIKFSNLTMLSTHNNIKKDAGNSYTKLFEKKIQLLFDI